MRRTSPVSIQSTIADDRLSDLGILSTSAVRVNLDEFFILGEKPLEQKKTTDRSFELF